MPSLSIFGVTGSIGTSAMQLWQEGVAEFEIDTVSAHENLSELIRIAKLTNARHVVIGNETHFAALKAALPDCEVAAGAKALAEAATRKVDICLNAVIGAAGLPVSLGAAGNAKRLALANKESLVCAGELLKRLCKAGGTEIISVDSEHSAIFQCLNGENAKEISRLILTASGGPFRKWSLEEMKNAQVKDALNHPNWDMGARITVDSASMFNKALEMIEARELFDVTPEQIEVIVHPQSIIHSLVEFTDHTLMAQMGVTDMRHVIGYALHYPKRKPLGLAALDLAAIARLDFEAPDEKRFKALRLARECMQAGGGHGAALNAAKEVALDAFMKGQIGFLDMADRVEQVLADGDWNGQMNSLSSVLDIDGAARLMAQNYINNIS